MQKTIPSALKGFDEFDDWDLDAVVEDKPAESSGNKYSNHSMSPPLEKEQKSAWSPPKPAGKLVDKKSPHAPSNLGPTSSLFPDFGAKSKNNEFIDDEFWRTPSLGQGQTKPPAEPEPKSRFDQNKPSSGFNAQSNFSQNKPAQKPAPPAKKQ